MDGVEGLLRVGCLDGSNARLAGEPRLGGEQARGKFAGHELGHAGTNDDPVGHRHGRDVLVGRTAAERTLRDLGRLKPAQPRHDGVRILDADDGRSALRGTGDRREGLGGIADPGASHHQHGADLLLLDGRPGLGRRHGEALDAGRRHAVEIEEPVEQRLVRPRPGQDGDRLVAQPAQILDRGFWRHDQEHPVAPQDGERLHLRRDRSVAAQHRDIDITRCDRLRGGIQRRHGHRLQGDPAVGCSGIPPQRLQGALVLADGGQNRHPQRQRGVPQQRDDAGSGSGQKQAQDDDAEHGTHGRLADGTTGGSLAAGAGPSQHRVNAPSGSLRRRGRSGRRRRARPPSERWPRRGAAAAAPSPARAVRCSPSSARRRACA